MKKPIFFCVFFLLASVMWADLFTYQFTKGEKYRIVSIVNEEVYMNNKYAYSASFLDKIALEVLNASGESGTVSAVFQVSERDITSAGTFELEDETRSIFSIDSQGRYTIDSSYLYPLTRNIPLFPPSNISPGFSWTAAGEEVHDLRYPYGIERPYRFPVDVQYKYLGIKTIDGRRLAQFEIQYSYMTKLKGVGTPTGPYYPMMISGESRMLYYWDVANGKPAFYQEEFDVIYSLSNGIVVEFIGTASGELILSQPLDTEKAVEEINKEIEKNNLEGVRVEEADDGVRIVLENIQFQPDSDEITRDEAKKIETIAEILKRYPGRDIRLTGHTAAVGSAESCMELSIRRAKAVGNALLQLGARDAEEMTIEGKGLSEPIATNETEEGRIKNRRVEIIILEN